MLVKDIDEIKPERGKAMEPNLRNDAEGYLRAARGGLARPEKFTADSLFQLVALAIEGFLVDWLDRRGHPVSPHGFRSLVVAFEKVHPLPPELRTQLVGLDRYQKLCEWIPIEPVKPQRDEVPTLLDLAARVGEFTRI